MYNRIINKFFIGDCSTQKEIPEMYGWCRFVHSWYPDSADLLDLDKLDLVNGIELMFKNMKQVLGFRLLFILVTIASLLTVVNICKKPTRKPKQN